jgi:hypothetical protein
MNDVYTYIDYSEPNQNFSEAVEAEKTRILGRLASEAISYMELACLPYDGAPLQPREVIDTAISQLEQSGSIQKADTEATFHQNLVVTYELAD